MKSEQNYLIPGAKGNLRVVVTPCLDTEKSKAPTLIIAHGFRGSLEGGGRAKLLADQASKVMRVIRFNFTPNQNLSTQIKELTAVIEYVEKEYNGDIFLLGRSLGGAASLVYAAQHVHIKGLVLWSTPADLRKTFCNALGNSNYLQLDRGESLCLKDERGEITLTPDFLTDFDKYDLKIAIRLWHGPLLIIHGEKDEVVELSEAKKMFAAAEEPKKFILLEGADHSFSEQGEQAAEVVTTWLADNL